jgi:ferritin-like metal-binding protein YciE
MLGHLDASPLRDAAMIFVSNQIESYEMGLYRSLTEFAKTLRLEEAVQLLGEIQGEERSAVEQMVRLGQSTIYAAAAGTHNPPPFALI